VPQSRSFAFSDPYEFGASLRGTRSELMPTTRGVYHGAITTVDFDRVWTQRTEHSLPSIIRQDVTFTRALMVFLSTPDQGPLSIGNASLSPNEILFHGRNAANHFRTVSAFDAGSMSLTREDLATASEAIAGHEIVMPSDSQVLRPEPRAMARLVSIHAAAGRIAEHAPESLAHPAIAKAIEQELTHAMIDCLKAPSPEKTKAAPLRHARIMRQFEDFLAERRYEPVYLAEICAAIGASERTLRAVCHEKLGIGPLRYLWLRRMHLAHRALLRADPAETRVTSVATQYGFWELGRFSVDYRALFGEVPSATLHSKLAMAR
jgi:AraC-like DNA-binding protein